MGVAELFNSLFTPQKNNLQLECQLLRSRVSELENTIKQASQDRADMESTLAINDSQLTVLQNELKEVEELQFRKQEIDQMFEQLEMQKAELRKVRVRFLYERIKTGTCMDVPFWCSKAAEEIAREKEMALQNENNST